MDTKEQILNFIRIKGPVLPVQISKEIKSDILIASAYLSELASNKKLKISCVKVGGSPLYYLPGQEVGLQKFSSDLHEKEKKIYDLLNQKKVLRDNELDPLSKTTIRKIKDFAVPLQVNYKSSIEIFWRWHLLPTEEAEKIIKLIIKSPETREKETKIEKAEEKPQKVEDEHIKEEEQKPLKKIKKPLIPKIDFINQTTAYFKKNNIELVEKNILRKNSEIDFIIKVPSSVGSLIYFCKSKNKKRINEGDISSAYIQSQSKKLPVLFLTTGELTKKAKEMLEKEFKGMYVKKL